MSVTGLGGSTLQVSFFDWDGSLNSVVSFTEGSDPEANFYSGGTDVGDISVDDDALSILMNGSFAYYAFAGDRIVIEDSGADDVPDFLGVTFSTTIAGLSNANVTFDAQSITITFSDFTVINVGTVLDIAPIFVLPPPPAIPPAGGAPIAGSDSADILRGSKLGEAIRAGHGDDTIYAQGGNDTVEAGSGNDQVFGGLGNDVLHGQAGNDRVFGGLGHDDLYGEMGDDTLGGGAGSDDLWGGMGADVLYGGDSDDRLDGGAGNDTLFGGTGADTLLGGAGDDLLYGGNGPDLLVFSAHSGNDVVYGLSDLDAIDLDGQTYVTSLNADGDVVLALSGGGSVTLFGVEAVTQDMFV